MQPIKVPMRTKVGGMVGMVMLALGGCELFGYGGIPWDRVQQLGGIRVDSAVSTIDRNVRVFLKCNLTGLDSVTVKPTDLNSYWGISLVMTAVQDTSVAFMLRAASPGKGDPRCPAVDVHVGARHILYPYYRDPDGTRHPMGVVVVQQRTPLP